MRIVTANYGPPADDYHRQYMKLKPFGMEQSRLNENIEAFQNRHRREKHRKKTLNPDENQPKITDLFAKVKTEDENRDILSLEQFVHDSTDDNRLPESEADETKFEDMEKKEIDKKLIFLKSEKIIKGERVKYEASIKEDVTPTAEVIDLSMAHTAAMPKVYEDPLAIIGRSTAGVNCAPQLRQSTIITSVNQSTMWPQNVNNGPILLHPTFDDDVSHTMSSGEKALMLSNNKVDRLTAEIEGLKRIITEQQQRKTSIPNTDSKVPQGSERNNEASESSSSVKDQQVAELSKEVAELKRIIKEKEEASYEEKLQKMITSAMRMAKQDAIRTTMRKMKNKQTLVHRFKIKKRRASSTVVRKDDDENSISENKEDSTTEDNMDKHDVSVDGYINPGNVDNHTYLKSELDVEIKASEPVGDSNTKDICAIIENNKASNGSLKVAETSRANNDFNENLSTNPASLTVIEPMLSSPEEPLFPVDTAPVSKDEARIVTHDGGKEVIIIAGNQLIKILLKSYLSNTETPEPMKTVLPEVPTSNDAVLVEEHSNLSTFSVNYTDNLLLDTMPTNELHGQNNNNEESKTSKNYSEENGTLEKLNNKSSSNDNDGNEVFNDKLF